MQNVTMRDHLMIVELLPDFVLGKLDEASLRRVQRHLEICETCQGEYANAMAVLGQLAPVSPPAPWLRGAVLRRAAISVREKSPAPFSQAPASGKRVLMRLLPERGRTQDLPFGHPLSRWVLVASSAVVIFVSGLLGWSYEQRMVITADDRIHALVGDPTAAFPLDDSDLSVSAAGVLFAEPEGREVYLVANGLPVLPQDQRYQVWLFTTEDELVSAGMLAVGNDGAVRELLQTPDPFADYVGVGLTAEPLSGSDTPTSALVLGGSFPDLDTAPGGAPVVPNIAAVNA